MQIIISIKYQGCFDGENVSCIGAREMHTKLKSENMKKRQLGCPKHWQEDTVKMYLKEKRVWVWPGFNYLWQVRWLWLF
jgi:hypothetical protein